MADERFSHISNDPRFQAAPLKERKIKIDERFQSMFKDERFNYKYSLDKRGRPFCSSTSENLRRYYDLSDDTSDESEGEDEDETIEDTAKEKRKTSVQKNEVSCHKLKSKKHIPDTSEVLETPESNNSSHKQELPVNIESEKKLKSCHLKESSKKDIKKEVSDDDDDDDDDKEEEEDESGLGSGQDLARGIGNETSSSDDSDFDSQDENCSVQELGNIVHDWGEMDKDAALTSEISSRLSVCNMDWENITAVDLFVVLNSFKPPQGAVLSVKIYPSEFGLKRMEEENMKGPPELAEMIKYESDGESNDSETEEGNTFHNEKLRQYEINRMKYYYAVVECDSSDTSNHIYNELDGAEYETSRTCFDMRFIPNDMEFTETARDVCTEMPSKDQYRPNQFVNNAMSSSTVMLSWDETNRHRVEFTTQKFSKKQDILMDDFKAYLASSSDESENEGLDAVASDNEHSARSESESGEEESETNMNRYKKLLEAAEENVKKKKQGNIEMEITWEPGLKEKTESLLKQRDKKQNSTPWLDYLDKVKTKRKDKKSARKAAKKETSDEKTLFSDDDMPSAVDLNDPYFSSELNSNTNKKSKTQKKKEKKKKKLAEDSSENLTEQEIEHKKQEKEELALLMADDDDDDRKKSKHHFDFEDYIEGVKSDKKKKTKTKKKLKQKSKIDEDDDFKIDLNDNRFEAVFTSGHYNIDKSAPDYKKSAGMEELIEEKLRRRYNERTQATTKRKDSSDISGSSEKYSKMNASTSVSTSEQSLDSLVRSIKSKMHNLHNSKKMKVK